MSRSDARRNATSSPSRRIWPEVGSSSPAIILSVVVLPQPEGPSRQKNEPSAMVKLDSFTAANSPNILRSFSTRISAMTLLGELRHDDEHRRAGERRQERPGVETDAERLHQHDDAGGDHHRGEVLPRAASEGQKPPEERLLGRRPGHGGRLGHLRTAPKVMPLRRWRLSSTVNTRIGTRNRVVPAPTAGQSMPPSPMIVGMKGGAVWALPEVSSTAKAYSFQAKIRQKIAVAAMPVAACGSTTFQKAWSRV